MYANIALLVYVASAILPKSINTEDCRISIDYKNGDLPKPQPLILTDSENLTFIMPIKKNVLSIPKNSSMILACSGSNNGLVNFNLSNFIKATCLSGKMFSVGSNIYESNLFKCKNSPKEVVKKSNDFCLEQHQRYDIGFQVHKDFLPLIEICRDEKTYTTYYSKMIMTKEILNAQSNVPRPVWKYSSYYSGYNMNKMYAAKSQLRSVATLLGSDDIAKDYVKLEKQQFLTRGHLSGKADFIYGSQQLATFWLINAAPQWASFNGGNWRLLENDVRKFAATRKLDLIVYTGVHGVAKLNDINGNEEYLYLHINETDKALPIPRFFWKVIYDPITNLATAFVGLNEPYIKNITDDMYLCENISNNLSFSWLTWKPNDIEHGISYICSVEELRKSVPTIPQLHEIGILS